LRSQTRRDPDEREASEVGLFSETEADICSGKGSRSTFAKTGKPILISFSGLDGAGKSTQIENLVSYLAAQGFRICRLAFWDDVVVGTRYRERFVHKVYGSEDGVGVPEKPVARRDKNVRKWYLTLARYGLYLLDALNLCRIARRACRSGADFVVFDRYIYDELANLPIANRFSRIFIRLIARLVPRPDIAYLLDADAYAARARKPEYPVEFMVQCRASYHKLANLLDSTTIIPPLPLEQAKQAVVDAYLTLTLISAQEKPMRKTA
jgi:thymidylate kinase